MKSTRGNTYYNIFMSMPKLKFVYSQNDSLNVIIHGGSKGIESQFMRKLYDRSVSSGKSTITFNFPYLDRGEESCSGEDLVEEQETIAQMINLISPFNFKVIKFIAKSLGGIALAKYLQNHLEGLNDKEIEVVILGYVLGEIDLSNFKGDVMVIQGSNDRFGNANAVRKELSSKGLVEAKVIEIKGADHSYGVPDTKEPKFEDEVVNLVFSEND